MTRVYYTAKPVPGDDSSIGRRLLLLGLSRDYGICDCEIVKDNRGKPYLCDHEDLHISITHTIAAVACAVSDIPVGIDAEAVTEKECKRVKERLFTDAEREYAGDDPVRFAKIWTMKESFVKMTGEGVSRRLAEFDVLRGENTHGAVFVPIDMVEGTAACVCMSQSDSVTVKEVTIENLKGEEHERI